MNQEKILSWQFTSALSILEMLPRLQKAEPSFTWQRRESDYEGTYILGRDDQGRKMRILVGEVPPCELELYGNFADAEKTKEVCLQAIEAANIQLAD